MAAKKPSKAGPRPTPNKNRTDKSGSSGFGQNEFKNNQKLPLGITRNPKIRPIKKGESELEWMYNTGKEGITGAVKKLSQMSHQSYWSDKRKPKGK